MSSIIGRPNKWSPDAVTDIAKRVKYLRGARSRDLPLSKDECRLLAIFDTPSLRDSVAARLRSST